MNYKNIMITESYDISYGGTKFAKFVTSLYKINSDGRGQRNEACQRHRIKRCTVEPNDVTAVVSACSQLKIP